MGHWAGRPVAMGVLAAVAAKVAREGILQLSENYPSTHCVCMRARPAACWLRAGSGGPDAWWALCWLRRHRQQVQAGRGRAPLLYV